MDILHAATAIITAVPAIVGAASLIVQVIAKITDITPSTKDDEVVGNIATGITKLQRLLDKIALNLPADKARQ